MTSDPMHPYYISSHDYLDRAVALLRSETPDSWFHAAFEMRCGIEARMAEYLEVWDHISKKRKKGWQIAVAHRNVENAFRTGGKICRWAIHDRESGELKVCFYYTPVSTRLAKAGNKLGNYLHRMKRYKQPDSAWWAEFRADLESTSSQLRIATTGTLLGPPLRNPTTGRVDMKADIPPGIPKDEMLEKVGYGKQTKIDVKYLNKLPEPLEPEAVTWWGDS